MKTIRIHEFGGPEVMKLEEVEMSVPASDEILIKVYATSVNPADYIIRKGGNDHLRPYLKLPLGLGLDVAGIVEETGSNVVDFKAGDKVYGVPNGLDGSYSEYVAAKASQFALMPETASFNEAGAIPSCALMAWSGIVDQGKVQLGQRVLINGAAGGIGTLAVQLAKWKGAYVIGTASEHNFDFLKQIGANEVVDYRNQNIDDLFHDLDIVFNASPVRDKEFRMRAARALKPEGVYVCTQIDVPFSDEFKTALAEKGATGLFVSDRDLNYREALGTTARLIDEDKLKVIISKVYPLEKVAEAHIESETKHVRGKLVLEIRKEND